MYYYDFTIAGLLLRIKSQFPLTNFYQLSHFRCEYSPVQKPDVEYSLQLLPDEWQIKGTQILGDRQNAVYHWHGEEHRYYFWSIYSKDKYVLVRHRLDDPSRYDICLQRHTLDQMLPQFRLSAFLFPERVLMQHQAFLLHASVIDWQGHGILFTAPSGVGKSTQANLWHQLEGAKILNGDRAVIRHQHGQFQAYGSPYAGTSGIFTNQSVPINAIVSLSQAPENALKPLSPVAAFHRLYRESTVCAWDTGFVDRLTDLLTNLIGSVPIYSLACRPDEDAVAILKKVIEMS